MARQGKRRLYRKGLPCIYVDGTGFAIKVKVRGTPLERRFPAGTPESVLIRERRKLRLEAGEEAAAPAARGSLDADVETYLRTLPEGRKRRDLARLLSHWCVENGRVSRWALTPVVIRQQLAAWRSDGVAASTVNKRLGAIRGLFRGLNTAEEPNPAADIVKEEEPESIGHALDYETIARILDALPDRGRPTGDGKGTRPTLSLTKVRLTLIAYSGLPHAQIKRIRPDVDIRWDIPAIRSRARRKGKGTKERWMPLLPQAVAALRILVAADALTDNWSADSMRASWRRACVKVIEAQLAAGERPIPHHRDPDGAIVPDVRPYDLRHSFGTVALRRSANVAGVQHLLQHSTTKMTLVYGDAAIEPAAADVAALLHDLPAPTLPAVPPTAKRKPVARTKRGP